MGMRRSSHMAHVAAPFSPSSSPSPSLSPSPPSPSSSPPPSPPPSPSPSSSLVRFSSQEYRAHPAIRVAAAQDVPALVELAHSVSLDGLRAQRANLDVEGFLVSGFTPAEYAEFVQRADHFLVLQIGRHIRAFLLAYSSAKIEPHKEKLNTHIRDTMCSDFVLVEQLCTSREHRRKGYATLLFDALCCRVSCETGAPELLPFYSVIVGEPANPRSVSVHKQLGFEFVIIYSESPDGLLRHIYRRDGSQPRLSAHVVDDFVPYKADKCFYTPERALDPDCVGIGFVLYDITPISEVGTFRATLRIMIQWRRPGLEDMVPREAGPRTKLDLGDPALRLRVPNFSMNSDEIEMTQNYAYIDRTSPRDIVTAQRMYRGMFRTNVKLDDFPADISNLPIHVRMWDSNPDDRRRYFRLLWFTDGMPWCVPVKNEIRAVDSVFLQPHYSIAKDKVAGTSYIRMAVPCIRKTNYYLRMVAVPICMISSLSIVTVAVPAEDLSGCLSNNLTLLLTAVAYFFIANDGLPKPDTPTQLDKIVLCAFLELWAVIMIQGATKFWQLHERLDRIINLSLICVCTAIQAFLLLRLVAYQRFRRRRFKDLGHI